MNGNFVTSLIKLTSVSLKLNVCIDEDFNSRSDVVVLQRKVNEKCRFDEQYAVNSQNEAELKAFKLQLNETIGSLKEKSHQIQELESQKSIDKAKIASQTWNF